MSGSRRIRHRLLVSYRHRSRPLQPAIPRGSLVIVEGRAPIWRYGMALHLLHASPAAARGSRSAPGGGGDGNAQQGLGPGPGGGCDAGAALAGWNEE